MTDRPIPFSAPMIRALLDDRKTMTRRVISERLQDRYANYDDWCSNVSAGVPTSRQWEREFFMDRTKYAPGDRLWVRESYFQFGFWKPVAGVITKGGRQKWAFVPLSENVWFDEPKSYRRGMHNADPSTPAWHKRLGRFMPRKYSRLTLIVESVKIERLQDISEADAIDEGVRPDRGARYFCGVDEEGEITCKNPITAFAHLWNSIHGPDAWVANPWIVAIGFSVVKANIDSTGASHV
jgi:hypothetical protein